MKKLTIAIDGPAGAGKSTVARIVAQRLEYTYIDTGAMYRAVTLIAIKKGLSGHDADQIVSFVEKINIKLSYINEKLRVIVDGTDVTEDIRMPEVSRMVSQIAQIPRVREAMVVLQRSLASEGGVVMDGRDIGTYVLPQADVKIFLTATIEERAQRRWKELCEKGFETDYEQLQNEIACRDQMDCERAIAPLLKAQDAILIDTTGLSIGEAVQTILNICKERMQNVL